MAFSWKERQSALQSLKEDRPELVIIGGGAVGCSIAAHAAEMGLNCVLFERKDIACGASGNSTGLAHAGLRYLAQGRLLYVFHESRERQRLQEIAPHWVRPFDFLLPVYQNDAFSFTMVRLGTRLYDLLGRLNDLITGHKAPRRPQVIKTSDLLNRIPGLKSEGLQGATEYFVDAKLLDSRFTLGFAQKAARFGARVITYAQVQSLSRIADGIQRVAVTDRLSGQSFDLNAPLVINAAGAWIDGIRHTAGGHQPLVRMSKGIHLIVDHIADSPLIFSTEVRGRVFFVLPIDKNLSLVGTTDTPYEGAPEKALPDQRDVQELIQRLLYFFPYLKQGASLSEAIDRYKQVHVRDLYWGVRPLMIQEGSTVDASREHALVKETPMVWSMPGVKLTATRAAGFEAAQEAWKTIRKVPLRKIQFSPLPGGEMGDFDRYVQDAQRRFRLGDDSQDLIPYLVSMYGTRYLEVLRWADHEPHYRDPIVPGESWIPAQAAHAVTEEMTLTLNDLLWRRTKWAHYRDIPDPSLYKIVNVMASLLNWSPDEVEEQVRHYREELQRHRL